MRPRPWRFWPYYRNRAQVRTWSIREFVWNFVANFIDNFVWRDGWRCHKCGSGDIESRHWLKFTTIGSICGMSVLCEECHSSASIACRLIYYWVNSWMGDRTLEPIEHHRKVWSAVKTAVLEGK